MATRTLSKRPIDPDVISLAAEVIKVLGHPLRLRLIEALDEGEKTVSQLAEELDAEQAIVSQQLIKMRGRGIVDCRRAGVNVYYCIRNRRVVTILNCIRGCRVEDFR
jgi:ArsR family transcriptional regulator